jgi:hypothetical protein
VNTFLFAFKDVEADVLLELTNATSATLRSVEILTIFLKDEGTPGGPSQAHIRFATVGSIRPNENVVISHKTWLNGKPAAAGDDQMERLKIASGALKPYVLDISWMDPEGKTCFQRIPVGH